MKTTTHCAKRTYIFNLTVVEWCIRNIYIDAHIWTCSYSQVHIIIAIESPTEDDGVKMSGILTMDHGWYLENFIYWWHRPWKLDCNDGWLAKKLLRPGRYSRPLTGREGLTADWKISFWITSSTSDYSD